MRIIIANVQAPFIRGGAEYLAESLAVKLGDLGHEVELVKIPFKWYPAQTLLEHIIGMRLFDLSDSGADLMIGLKFPAYMLPFANKKLWLLHQFRQVYELWGTSFQEFPNTPEGERARAMITCADNVYLREARQIFTNSKIVARRLKQYNNIDADAVLYPPLLNPELFQAGGSKPYFFYPSRMTASKRQILAIEAMRYVRSPFTLVLAGNPDSQAYGKSLERLIAEYGLESKVKMLGYISDTEKAQLMSDCFAALYIPYDEDSYGYVTLEAFQSHKPVITMQDSGGTDEIITDGFNGLMVEPTPQALAEAMERLWANPAQTERMGHDAYQSLSMLNISWAYVLDNLTS